MAAGTGRVGSNPTGYERGSGRFGWERDEDDEAMGECLLLLLLDEENVDVIDSRERHDEPDEEVADELTVLVDMKDEAVELRPGLGERMDRSQPKSKITYVTLGPVKTFAESNAEDALRAGPRCVAWILLVFRHCRPWLRWSRLLVGENGPRELLQHPSGPRAASNLQATVEAQSMKVDGRWGSCRGVWGESDSQGMEGRVSEQASATVGATS